MALPDPTVIADPSAGSSADQQPMQAMSMSEAMDVLDEFHIKRSDWQRVDDALDVVLGPDDVEKTPSAEPDADDAMAKEMFATDRNRKAM